MAVVFDLILYQNDTKVLYLMGKHLDYVEQSDGTYKWQLAEIPAVKATPTETPKAKKQTKKVSKKKSTSILSE